MSNCQLSQVDVNMTNTPKRISYYRGYGNILNTYLNVPKQQNHSTVFNRIQPLCGTFGEHLPPKTTMPVSQTNLAWAKNVTAPVKCNPQHSVLNQVISTNSQLPDELQYHAGKYSSEDANLMMANKAGYYSTTGEFHQ